ncbi:MAG: cysteine protease [Sulfuritalea sp.]|nr:cysteine protease [Sulfuritalea sp.]
MIFHNPSGAPELACDQCGCRWFDRTNNNCCYECGSEVSAESIAEFQRALLDFSARETHRGDAIPGEADGAREGKQ